MRIRRGVLFPIVCLAGPLEIKGKMRREVWEIREAKK